MEMVKDALDQLRGAVMIVYPMGLPPYDPIRMEFENKEDLSGTQVRAPGLSGGEVVFPQSPSGLAVLLRVQFLLHASSSVLDSGKDLRGWYSGLRGSTHT